MLLTFMKCTRSELFKINFRHSILITRNSSVLQKLRGKDVILVDKSRHKLIYEYSYVKYVASVFRMKVSYTLLTVGVSPLLLSIDSTGRATLCGLYIGLLQFVILQSVSKLLNNIIGRIYVNKDDKQEIIICAINSYGCRIDQIHDIKGLVNLGPRHKIHDFLNLVTLNDSKSNNSYLLDAKNCRILDADVVKDVIEDLNHHKEQKKL